MPHAAPTDSNDFCTSLIKTTLPTFGNGQCTVTRRFNDFVWLRQRLIEETAQYQARYTIPSLPSDTWTSMIWRSGTHTRLKRPFYFISQRNSPVSDLVWPLTIFSFGILARFDPQFIADRIKGLETFLNCVTHNPFCMYSRSLQQFLEQADFPCK